MRVCVCVFYYKYLSNSQQRCKPILWTSQVNFQGPHLTETGGAIVALDVIAAAAKAQRKRTHGHSGFQ